MVRASSRHTKAAGSIPSQGTYRTQPMNAAVSRTNRCLPLSLSNQHIKNKIKWLCSPLWTSPPISLHFNHYASATQTLLFLNLLLPTPPPKTLYLRTCDGTVLPPGREGASFGALLRCHFFKGTSRNAQRCPRLTAGHICVLCTTLSPPEMIYPVGLLALFSLWHRGRQTLGHGPRLAHHRFLYGL